MIVKYETSIKGHKNVELLSGPDKIHPKVFKFVGDKTIYERAEYTDDIIGGCSVCALNNKDDECYSAPRCGSRAAVKLFNFIAEEYQSVGVTQRKCYYVEVVNPVDKIPVAEVDI